MNNYSYIAIEGNIGAGKTSLTQEISRELNGIPCYEQFENNPFLPDFYKTGGANAFSLEMFFLAQRYKQLRTIEKNSGKLYISDHFIAKSLLFAGFNLKEHELDLFIHFYEMVANEIPVPDLIIYLQGDIDSLQKNIHKRGRGYEKWITNDYLTKVSGAYRTYFEKEEAIPVLIVNTSKFDSFNPNQLNGLINKVLSNSWKPGIQSFDL